MLQSEYYKLIMRRRVRGGLKRCDAAGLGRIAVPGRQWVWDFAAQAFMASDISASLGLRMCVASVQ